MGLAVPGSRISLAKLCRSTGTMAAAIPNAKLEVIDYCSHLSSLEQEVNRALRDWLLA